MPGSRIADVESALAASRAGADRRLVESLRQAQRLESDAAEATLAAGRGRIAELTALRDSIAADAARIEFDSARLAEALATASDRLVEIEADADFSPPPWRSALGATVDRNLEPGT